MRFGLFVLLGIASSMSFARASDQADFPTRAVQAVTVAKLAPLACDGSGTDEKAVADFLEGAGVSEQDLVGSYQVAMRDVAATLASSVNRDREAACSQLWDQLGEEGLGVVTVPDDDG